MGCRILKLEGLNGACQKQMHIVKQHWPNGIPLTAAAAKKVAELHLDVDWAAKHLLKAPELAAYEKATAPELAAYEKARETAWAAYEKATAPELAAYEKARATAWAAYEKAKAPEWAAYKKARATALLSLLEKGE